jgi:hypothetical protein
MPLSSARVLRTFRYALYFDGVDDRVTRLNPSGFTSYEYTIIAWIRFTQLRSEVGHPRTWFVTRTWWGPILSELTIGDRMLLRFGTSTSWFDLRSTTVFDKNWHNVALIVKSGEYGSIYVDGRLDAYATTSQTINPADMERIQLGFLLPPSVFQGFISQVLIYSRVLSGTEIRFNYSNPDNPVRNGLVLWLQAHPDYVEDVDGDGVPEWLDLSGNNNHGKIYGARLVELIRTPVR